MYPYPKLRTGLCARWTSDGRTLRLYDNTTKQGYRLSRTCGLLLCSLDGWTDPGLSTCLSAAAVYRWLRLFACHGLLEETDTWVTAPGCVLWNRPCLRLRRGQRRPALRLYIRLLERLWLPLLAALLFACANGIGCLPRLRFGAGGILLCLLLGELPAMVLHELAHAAAANDRGIPVSSFGFGIRSGLPCACTMIPLLPFAPRHDRRAVYRAGPLCNLCLGCGLLLLCRMVPLFRQEIVFWMSVSNLMLAGINLLPLEGLDGNGILTSFPSAERALSGGRIRRKGWPGFLERAVGTVLRGLFRIGLPVFVLYEGLCLWEILREVFAG